LATWFLDARTRELCLDHHWGTTRDIEDRGRYAIVTADGRRLAFDVETGRTVTKKRSSKRRVRPR